MSKNGCRERSIDISTIVPMRNPRRIPFFTHGVTCMPPMFVNVGAYVGDNTMIDSHALVGSCAQIGENCHISAAAQIGGVLEPVGAMPVIIESHAMVGGNCGVYEGTIVKERAVLGSGVGACCAGLLLRRQFDVKAQFAVDLTRVILSAYHDV